MHLDRFEELEVPLPPSKITEIAQSVTDANYNIKWNQTMIHIPIFYRFKNMAIYITRNCLR
jgi:hypothetical protein